MALLNNRHATESFTVIGIPLLNLLEEEQVDVDQRRRIEAPLPVTVETLEQNLTSV